MARFLKIKKLVTTNNISLKANIESVSATNRSWYNVKDAHNGTISSDAYNAAVEMFVLQRHISIYLKKKK